MKKETLVTDLALRVGGRSNKPSRCQLRCEQNDDVYRSVADLSFFAPSSERGNVFLSSRFSLLPLLRSAMGVSFFVQMCVSSERSVLLTVSGAGNKSSLCTRTRGLIALAPSLASAKSKVNKKCIGGERISFLETFCVLELSMFYQGDDC